ncbi:MAG: phosphotyrosine protein phosphatase [Eubacterium sp.]|nr:phosphotyrosine protein phosphatase [Eubacterium sp.]
MKYYSRIIFVSNTDTSKGPMAVGVLKNCVLNKPVEIESRGLVALFPEPVNEKSEAVMISNGVRLEGYTSRQLNEEDFDENTLVIAIEEEQYMSVKEKFGDVQIYLLEGLIGERVEICDPYGKALSDYGQCFEEIQKYIEKLAKIINEQMEMPPEETPEVETEEE